MTREDLVSKLESNIPEIEGKNIWIWGVGHWAQLYQEGLKRIEKFTVCGYCDNNSKKWGERIGGKPVVSPEQLYKEQNICVLICSPQKEVVSAVGEQLNQQNIEWHCLEETIFKLYKAEIMECYDMLDSRISKDTYAHIINCRIDQCMPDDSYVFPEEYFALPQFKNYGKETFVDCGAYTGDTIEQYLWKKCASFHKIIAFEPDKGNFRAMEHRIERLKKEWNISEEKIALHCYAVGKQRDRMFLEENGDMSSRINQSGFGGVKLAGVEVVSLDEFLKEPYTFLKADIESFEHGMIEGAQNGIRTYKPLLAICIYHNAMDLFGIQLLLHRLVPEYNFAVRHHSVTFDETVLYAYI